MTYTRQEFIEKYGPYIHKVTKSTGILPGTVVAVAILESSGDVNGSWKVGGSKLSQKANNFFGIKCHSKWTGPVYNIDTNEQTPSGAVYVQSNACFRAYSSVEKSINDYIRFLKENERYANAGVFSAKTVQEQAQRLKNAGYATAVNYASTVYSVYQSIANNLELTKKKVVDSTKIILISSAAIAVISIIGIVHFSRKE